MWKTFYTGEQPYAFLKCDTNFNDEKSMQPHDSVHTSDRTFICATCGKSFLKHYNFKRHVEIHNKEFHECVSCNKSFLTMAYLKRHQRLHSTDKPHACGECAKRFSVKFELVRHERKHSGDRPFKCVICQKVL